MNLRGDAVVAASSRPSPGERAATAPPSGGGTRPDAFNV